MKRILVVVLAAGSLLAGMGTALVLSDMASGRPSDFCDRLPNHKHCSDTTTTTTTTTEPPPTETEPPPPTETEPPPPTETEPPPSSDCTHVLAAGGDLSNFLSSLSAGDVGCLRAGDYVDGCSISWGTDGSSSNRIALRNFPGESVTVRTNLSLSGDYLTIQGFTITDLRRCSSTSGVNMSGVAPHVLDMTIDGVSKHGMILHTSSRDAFIARNFVRDVGPTGSTLEHGIYVQATGHVVVNNVFADIRGGYGIHLYSSPSNIIVAQNTTVRSETRAGILVDSSGGNIRVINNIAALNATNGITYRRCGTGCVVDRNLVHGNSSSGIGGSLANQATNTLTSNPLFADTAYRLQAGSPAIDAARTDFSFSPDRDGVARPRGSAPDLGAYESG